MRINYLVNDVTVASAIVTPMPGSSQVAIIHDAFVTPKARDKGYGNEAHADRLAILKDQLFDLVVCTVNMANEKQLAILKKHGWKLGETFLSSKTGHTVGLFVRVL